jgi:hypothetical protein
MCPTAIYKVSKIGNFENWGPLIEHDPQWINFVILICINEKIDILDTCIRFGKIDFICENRSKP